MKKLASLIIVALTLASCASAIMQGYVGKDIREVVLDYGPPVNALDLANGQRAFQWRIDDSFTTPIQTTTTGNINNYGYNTWFTANTITTGGQTYSSHCIYTLFAERDQRADAWIVTGFRQPKILCE